MRAWARMPMWFFLTYSSASASDDTLLALKLHQWIGALTRSHVGLTTVDIRLGVGHSSCRCLYIVLYYTCTNIGNLNWTALGHPGLRIQPHLIIVSWCETLLFLSLKIDRCIGLLLRKWNKILIPNRISLSCNLEGRHRPIVPHSLWTLPSMTADPTQSMLLSLPGDVLSCIFRSLSLGGIGQIRQVEQDIVAPFDALTIDCL